MCGTHARTFRNALHGSTRSDVKSKNQPITTSRHEGHTKKRGRDACVRTDRHEEKGYPFVPCVRHSHFRWDVAVRRRIRSHRPPIRKIVYLGATVLSEERRRHCASVVIRRGWGKRVQDSSAEPKLDEREYKPRLRA